MTFGMPISLWKYITLELWRIIALTAAVLVAVIAFAASIKPMADGKITPLEALQFMGLAVVPMLQYALPFAAGFGATLAYHRLSHDNEVTAAYAGGVSHRAVLLPAIITLPGERYTLTRAIGATSTTTAPAARRTSGLSSRRHPSIARAIARYAGKANTVSCFA